MSHFNPRGSSEFVPQISNPAHPLGTGPVIVFDQAHFNYHRFDSWTTDPGSAVGLKDTIEADGYVFRANYDPFTPERLRDVDVLIVMSACSDWYMVSNSEGKARTNARNAAYPAFTPEEARAVSDFVADGGSLLLIYDHTPFGPAAQILANEFGATLPSQILPIRGTQVAFDFVQARGTLAPHPIFKSLNEPGVLRSFQMSHCYWPHAQTLLRFPAFVARADITPDGWDLFWNTANQYFENKVIDYSTIAPLLGSATLVPVGTLPALACMPNFRKRDTDVGGRVMIFGEQSKFTTSWQGTGGLQNPETFELVRNIVQWLSKDI